MRAALRPIVATALVATAALAAPARAEPKERLTFQAGHVEADVGLGDVTLEKGVELRYGRYRLRSERIRLRVERGAASFEGDARLALCPCPDPPLVFAARGGRFEPPGDLVLRFPRVEIGGVPVFALPWLWLRAPDQPGLLPPIVALRGADGLLLGSGVHLPWRGSDGAGRALDLSAAGFTRGGVELGATLSTPESRTGALVDLIHGTRAAIEARGAIAEPRGPAALAWDLDAVRGDRARSATVDLAAAAKPFDVGAAEATLRTGTAAVSAIAGGAIVARAVRGEGPIATGPRATFAAGGPIGRLGSWSADAAGIVLAGAAPAGGLPLARGAVSAEIDARPGPFELRASAGGRARYAGQMEDGPSREAAIAARAELSLPFVRTFGDGPAPLAHWITPVVSVRGALADVRGTFFTPLDGAVPAASWIAAAGVTTAVGRYAGPALRLDARAGATGDASTKAQPLLHARLSVDAPIAAVAIETAAVGDGPSVARGYALTARARLAPDAGPSLRIDAAAQGGAGAGRARAIAAGAWAALPGDELAYLSASGVTLGGELSIPWARTFRTAARGDVDLASGLLLAVRGLAEYRHPCGCFGLGLMAAHRLGRDGVDVALSVDVMPKAP